MFCKLKVFYIIFLCISTVEIFAQAIVNIEDLRREGQVGFFTNVTASLYAARGNRDRDFYSIQMRFDNNSNKAESFFILQQSERKSNDMVMDESKFLHGRYVFVGKEKVNWEVFTQYSENPFRNYKKRSVLGGGLRYELSKSARLGAGLLSEEETDLSGKAITTERLGFYLHNVFEMAENISFNPTLYFQPSIDDFDNDYKTSMILTIVFKVNKNLNIKMQFSSFRDSSPPMLAKKIDESLSTMFSYDLSNLWTD